MCHADEQHVLLTFERVLLWRGWLQVLHQLEGFLQLALPQVMHSQVEPGLRTHIQQAWQNLHHTTSLVSCLDIDRPGTVRSLQQAVG